MVEKLKNKKEKIKKNIIKNANTIFAKYGYNKTTMNDIAKSMGKSKSALYHYYSSKEEIFYDVLIHILKNTEQELLNSIKGSDSPVEQLKNYILTRAKILNEFAKYYITFKYEYFEHFHIIEKIRHDFDKREIKIIESILKNGVDKSIFEIENTKQLAEAFLYTLKGYEYHWALEKINRGFKKNINSLLDVLLYGILKR